MAKATSNHFVHGHAGYKKSPTYKTWRGMKLRCNNPTNASYKNYGAKGIGYCERWETFELFLEDMGERPEGMTLDRRDRSKDYCPENCRWATRKQQSEDRSITVWIEHDGQRHTATEWSRITGIKLTTILYRLKAGWAQEDVLSLAPKHYHPRTQQQ